MIAADGRRAGYVTVSAGAGRSGGHSVLYGLAFAGAAVALEKAFFRFLAPDSYQLLLGAVAISVVYAGMRAGLAALLLTGLAKWFLFLPVVNSFRFQDLQTVARFVLFLCLGLLICWLGQRLHASDRRLRLLSGLLPICAWCKRIKDDQGEWRQLEAYIHDHSEADFTHGLCPDCARRLMN
jgi:K+-sensing histidine kinase KdpD